MCSKSRTAYAILLLCFGLNQARGNEVGTTARHHHQQQQRRIRRRQQEREHVHGSSTAEDASDENNNYIPRTLLDLDPLEEVVETITPTRTPTIAPIPIVASGSTNFRQEAPEYVITKQQVSGTSSEEATISGKVYNDSNQNLRHDTPANSNANSNNSQSSQSSSNEQPIQGAVAKLFSCRTGSRIGLTRTNSEGRYSFTIPSTSLPPPSSSTETKACFYIQFTVNNYIFPNAVFTTPKNGETNDIYLRAGNVASGVNVGVVAATSSPTRAWTSYSPTTMGGGWEDDHDDDEMLIPGIARTLSPTAAHPFRGEESVGVPVAFEVEEKATPAPMGIVILALPTESVSLPTTASSNNNDGGVSSSAIVPASLAVPSPSPVVVVETEPSGNDAVVENENELSSDGDKEKEQPDSEEVPEPDEEGLDTSTSTSTSDQDEKEQSGEGKEVDENTDNKPDKDKEKQELPENGDLIKPSDTYEEQEKLTGKEGSNDVDAESSKILSLDSTIRIRLANLQTNMDDDSTIALFEDVCVVFLQDQLQYATPPVYDLGCEVVGQTLDRGRALLPSDNNGSSLRRGLSGSGLFVDVKVTGEVEKTKRVQEVEDVQFDALLMGTFNVQGYLFAEALKEGEEEASEKAADEESKEKEETGKVVETSPMYFAAIGGVQAVEVLGSTDEALEQNEEVGDTVSNRGVIVAMVAGGVIAVILAFITVRKIRQTRSERKAAAASGGGGSKNGAKSKPSVKAGTKGNSVKANRRTKGTANPRKSTKSPTVNTAAMASRPKTPTTSPTNTVSTGPLLCMSRSADSEDIEIGLTSPGTPPSRQSPPSPSSLQPRGVTTIKPRSRAATTHSPSNNSKTASRTQRDIIAPAGKLGIMVANTTGHGPAIHTIRPDSPMKGMVHVNDIIVAVNDVDTRQYSAEQIMQVMKDTVEEERKITVLSKYPSKGPN